MCISCRRHARFLISWKTFIVQRSYAAAAMVSLPRSAISSRRDCRTGKVAQLDRQFGGDLAVGQVVEQLQSG